MWPYVLYEITVRASIPFPYRLASFSPVIENG